MSRNWVRKEVTTRGSDPTVVVTWTSNALKLEITEFQNVYVTERLRSNGHAQRLGGFEAVLCEELHKALEEAWQAIREADESLNFERKMDGWDPNP